MSNAAVIEYKMPTFTGLIGQGWSGTPLFRDGVEHKDMQPISRVDRLIDVQVRSGDYFVTLATALDALGRDIEDYSVRSHIEDIVSDLIHLQDNYTIIKQKK